MCAVNNWRLCLDVWDFELNTVKIFHNIQHVTKYFCYAAHVGMCIDLFKVRKYFLLNSPLMWIKIWFYFLFNSITRRSNKQSEAAGVSLSHIFCTILYCELKKQKKWSSFLLSPLSQYQEQKILLLGHSKIIVFDTFSDKEVYKR